MTIITKTRTTHNKNHIISARHGLSHHECSSRFTALWYCELSIPLQFVNDSSLRSKCPKCTSALQQSKSSPTRCSLFYTTKRDAITHQTMHQIIRQQFNNRTLLWKLWMPYWCPNNIAKDRTISTFYSLVHYAIEDGLWVGAGPLQQWWMLL